MNVANLELCKTLHELSGWEQSDFFYTTDRPFAEAMHGRQGYFNTIPAYELGYLLRKLPNGATVMWNNERSAATLQVVVGELLQYGKTPEDAIAKLCCELFRQGILTR